MKLRLASVFLGLLPFVVYAHHGNFTYDGSRVITLEGEVLEFLWTNPHSVLRIRTDDGNEVDIETDGPSLIGPMGTTPDSLLPGERIFAYVSPSNRGRDDEFLGREVTKADGTLVRVSVAFARRQERTDLPVSDSVIGTWVPDRTNLFAHVASSESWSLTGAGQASFDAYDTDRPFAQTNCIAATAPTLMMYPTANILTQRNGYIEINADWMGAVRTIYMDGRAHPDEETRFLQGHSTGYWEDGALVIETTNFTDNPIGNVFSITSGESKRVLERLELTENGQSLAYTFTLEDPEFLVEPVTASYLWHYRPDVSASAQPCDPSAASRYLED